MTFVTSFYLKRATGREFEPTILKRWESANWWRVYFGWFNQLAFQMEEKRMLLSTFGMNLLKLKF